MCCSILKCLFRTIKSCFYLFVVTYLVVFGAVWSAVPFYPFLSFAALFLCPPSIVLWWAFDSTDPAVPMPRFLPFAPWFHSCHADKLARAAGNCGGAGCDIVFVGDSITEALQGGQCYYNTSNADERAVFLLGQRPGLRSLIIAGGGDQTQHTLYHLAGVLPLLRSPKVFFVMIGTNNFGPQGRQAHRDVARGVMAVTSAIHAAHPDAKVLAHPILPRLDIGCLECQSKIDAANQAINKSVQIDMELENPVKLVDCLGVFPRSGPEMMALMPDALHPNAEGYRKWFQCLWPYILSELPQNGTCDSETCEANS